jgi:hypothetical protein
MGMVMDRWCSALPMLGVFLMKKTLLAGIAALLMATSAHATQTYCAVVLKPPSKVTRDKEYNSDQWLALREKPSSKSYMIVALRAECPCRC